MDDLFLRTIVRSYTDLPRFVRRDWLAASLDAQLADPECRFVLLTAEPGAGKSAFLAQLAADHPDWPVYFIRRDQRTAFEGAGARSLLLRVGFQLAALHPELYSLEQVRLEVEQRLGHVEGQGVVGVEVERLIASPFHKTLIRVTQDIQTAGAPVAGIRIEEWVATPRLISLDDLQNLALLDPARAFARQRPDARIVILIDALDELRYQKPGEQRDQQPDEGLLAWLESLPELPDIIRIVMTSRPADAMLALLRQKQRPYLRELTISATDQLVKGDLETYAKRLVEPPSIRGALAAAGREPAAFVTEIVLKADGNIGYLGALGRAVDQAAAAPERRALLDELLTLTRLPDDTQGLFAFFLHQIKTRGGATGVKVQDPASGRTAVLEAWPEVFHPILALLSVNLEPLTIEQIHALCGTLAGRNYVIDAVQWLDQFLDRVGRAYRLYHTTLAEFLTSAGTRDDPDTADFYVDAEAEHRRLAGLLEAAGGDIWIDSADRLEQARREYARRHLVRHLALGRDWDRLYRVIDDGQYGRGKLRADPSTFFYSLDIDTAIEAASRKDRASDVKTRELPRLWRYKLLRVTLASYADDLPPSVYEVMALVDRLGEAADLAALITDPGQQAQALGGIAAVAAQQPERLEQARDLLRRAYEAAARVADEKGRAANLQQLLDTSAFVLSQVPAFEQPVREPAERLARSLGDLSLQTYALAGIARFLHAANDAPGAGALRDDVGAIARSVDADDKGPLLACHAALCTLTGAFTLAHESVAAIEPPIARLSELLDVAVAERRSGLATADATFAEASTLAQTFSADADRARSRFFFAQAHLALDEGGQAVPLLNDALGILRHADFPERHETLAGVADGLRRGGALPQYQDAVRLLYDLAITELDQSAPRPGHGYSFSLRGAEIGDALSSLDERQLALDVAAHMPAQQRSAAINAVVRSFVRGGLWDEALRLATDLRNVVVDSSVRISFTAGNRSFGDSDQAFIDIIEGLRRAGEPTRALETVDQLQSTAVRVEALANVAAAQFETGGVDAAKALIERAVREVRLANSRADRPQGTRDRGVAAGACAAVAGCGTAGGCD